MVRKKSGALFELVSGGFTIIELLVVIAIIGILSSVVLTSLSSSRAKARDARRISDLKQMSTIISLLDDGTLFKKADGSACTFGPENHPSPPNFCDGTPNLSAYFDPSVPTGPTWSGGCTGPCPYRMATLWGIPPFVESTANWCITAYLESGVGSLPKGMVHVGLDTNGGVIAGLVSPGNSLGSCN